jgi:3-phenylpropionate/cinnamic acid dioxygenase small subunit
MTDMSSPTKDDLDFGLPPRRDRVRAREPQYMDVLDFLSDEAVLLNEDRLQDWLGMLVPEISYFMPVRTTRMRKDGTGFSREYGHFDENFASLSMRVRKNATPSSWGEDPPSRVRRFVTNVRVFTTDQPDDLYVVSDLLVTRSRLSSTTIELVTAERRDIVRGQGSQLKLAARRILVDQATIATMNLAIFL